jgi:hypothetical protein
MADACQIHSEQVLGNRLVVNVAQDGWGRVFIYIGSTENHAGSMKLMALELAALLDGPLERALGEATRDRQDEQS